MTEETTSTEETQTDTESTNDETSTDTSSTDSTDVGSDVTGTEDSTDTSDTDAKDGKADDEEDEAINPDDYVPESRAKKADEATQTDEDDEADPEIDKVLQKKLAPLERKLQDQSDELEITEYLTANPEFSKYKPIIKKYVAHPDYKNIPIKNIVAIVAAGEMQKIGAQKERAAAKKVKETKGGGQPARKLGVAKIDWSKASSEEFARKRAEVMGQGR